jgi:hypothetical protein
MNIVRPAPGSDLGDILWEMATENSYPKEIHLERGNRYTVSPKGTIPNLNGLKIIAVGRQNAPRPVVEGVFPDQGKSLVDMTLGGNNVVVRDIEFIKVTVLSPDGYGGFMVENCHLQNGRVWIERNSTGDTNYIRNCTFYESFADAIDVFGPTSGTGAPDSPVIVEDCFFERVGIDTNESGGGDSFSTHNDSPDCTVRRCVFLNCAAGIGRQQHTAGDLVVDQCLVVQNLDKYGLEERYNGLAPGISDRPGCFTHTYPDGGTYNGWTITIKNSIFLFKFMPDMDNQGARSCIRVMGEGIGKSIGGKTYIKHNLFINYSEKSSFPVGPGTLSASYTPSSIYHRQGADASANMLLNVDNNIFLAPNGGTHICVDTIDDPGVPSDFTLAYTGDHNLFWPSTGDVFGEVSAAALGSRYLAFTGSPGWLEITLSSPWTHNNVLTDPGLINDRSLDPIELMPAVRSGGGASGVIDAGSDQTATVPIDFYGNERQTTSDIGPFEMDGATPLGHLERLIRIFDSGSTKRFEIRLDMAANQTVTVPVAQPIDPGKVTLRSVTLSDNTDNSCVLRDGHAGPVITSVAAGGSWSDDITLPPGHPLIAEFSTGDTAGEVSMVVEYEITPEANNERRAMVRSYLDAVSDPRRKQGN